MIFYTFKRIKHRLLMPILITAALLHLSTTALELDLNETCSGTSLYYCTLTNLTNSIEDPLIWITKTPAAELNELLIYNSVMGRLPAVVFEIAPKLHTLIMHNCAVNSLFASNFDKAQQLHKLVLQQNRLFIIPERVFAGCYNLEELHLSQNTIHMIHRYAFVRLQRLKYLDLQENGIRTLAEGVFDDLINVEHINLSFNEIEVINANTFAKNLNLKTLLLNENKFSNFAPHSLMHLKHLVTLDLSNTVLEELQVQSVDYLLVQGSQLKRCIISGSVIKLNAANNALKSIQVADKASVRELELHGNLFESLEDIVGMLHLQKLDMSKNQLTTLKTSYSPLYLPLPNLQTLNLASNRLLNLTYNYFVFLNKLKSLDLAFNHLVRLDSHAFEPLVNLEKFYIEGNRLFEFNYVDFKEKHTYLHEVGVFENDWEFRYLKRMLNYFRVHGIHLPMRFTPADSSSSTSYAMTRDNAEATVTKSSSSALKSSLANTPHQEFEATDILNELTGASGIHPYWTTRDILALTTLIFVFLILLLQFFSILQEERCLPSWCRCCFGRLDNNREREPLRHSRHRPLVEDTDTSNV